MLPPVLIIVTVLPVTEKLSKYLPSKLSSAVAVELFLLAFKLPVVEFHSREEICTSVSVASFYLPSRSTVTSALCAAVPGVVLLNSIVRTPFEVLNNRLSG